jgi:hypothetical protein
MNNKAIYIWLFFGSGRRGGDVSDCNNWNKNSLNILVI